MRAAEIGHFTAPVNRFGGYVLVTEGGYVVDCWQPRDREPAEDFAFHVACQISTLVGTGSHRCVRNEKGELVVYRSGPRGESWVWGVVQ